MANQSFRAAWWAVCFAVALSTCMLLSDPEQSRRVLSKQQSVLTTETAHDLPASPLAAESKREEPPPSSVEGVDPGVPVTGSAVPLVSLGSDDASDEAATASPPRADGDGESTAPEHSPIPIHDVSHGRPARPLFEELPPPPEFAQEALEGATTTDDSGLLAMAEQFAEFGTQMAGLRSEMELVQESQTKVARSIERLVTEEEDGRTPLEVEIRTWVRPVAIRADASSGVIDALVQSESLEPATTGPSSSAGLRCAWIQEPPEQILRWLGQIAPSSETTMRSLRVTQTSTAELELGRQFVPRMQQARGRRFVEWRQWVVADRLMIRAFTVQPGFVEVEFATRDSRIEGTGGSWTHAAVPDNGVLVITIPVTRAAAFSERSQNGSGDEAIEAGSRELVVLLAPRCEKARSDPPTPLSADVIPPALEPEPLFAPGEIETP